MKDIFSQTGRSFVILNDEWDCLFREYKENQTETYEALKIYIQMNMDGLKNAISTMNWHDVISSVNDSRKLLEAMWNIEKITK